MSRSELSITVARVKEKVQLSKIVGADVVLRKRGREFVGQCPFHQEKTASFYVNDDKCAFYCFGCGASGDIFEYVIKRDRINFMQALEKLAESVGIRMPERSNISANSSFSKQKDVLQRAAEFFKSELAEHRPALEYCEQRGLDAEMREIFSIGYSGGKQLLSHLAKTGFTEEDAVNAGLAVQKGTSLVWRFVNRLMFPVFNKSGWPIAFGGRALSKDSMPKYLNSPESDLFQKREILYGYNIASRTASDTKQIIVVEGYIDVVMMHKFGFSTSVASMGTAFSSEHLAKIWKYSSEPIICFDADEAGYRAMTRLATMAMQYLQPGKSLRFCMLPSGSDPDTCLRNNGATAMQNHLNSALNLVDFFWEFCVRQLYAIENKTPEKTAKWKAEIENCLNDIHEPEIRKLYKAELKERIFNVLRTSSKSGQKTNQETWKSSNDGRFVAVQKNVMFPINHAEKMLMREALLLYAVISRPSIVSTVVECLSAIAFSNQEFLKVQSLIMDAPDERELEERLRICGDDVRDAVNRIEEIGKKYCNISEMSDNQVLEYWSDLYTVGFTRPNKKREVLLAKEDCAASMSLEAWERLKALETN